ncbi:MAG: ParB/RepB/Spo0J family partition protein [Elusimicrobia bacterium]|nr:ParB/RepB/Spo0J family partition protein [Elusimicrobiota bacterium]
MHKALGRGLESLIQPSSPAKGDAKNSVMTIAVDKIKPNKFQPRKVFNDEKLRELAESIKHHGLAQPIIVAPSMIPGEFELIAGERRWRATKLAGLKEVTAVIRHASEKERFHLALIENIQREDLNPIEEARAYKRLHDEFHHTQEELAKVLGKDRAVIANSLRLLQLSEDVQDAISQGLMSAGHGRMLAGIDNTDTQKELALRILVEKLTVRDIEGIVAGIKNGVRPAVRKQKKPEAELVRLAEELQRQLGTKVKIVGKSTKGKIEIHYFSLKDLERLNEVLSSITQK